jgi:hypothetical protein
MGEVPKATKDLMWNKSMIMGKIYLLYTMCQISCFLASYWMRVHHVKVTKFNCFLATAPSHLFWVFLFSLTLGI